MTTQRPEHPVFLPELCFAIAWQGFDGHGWTIVGTRSKLPK